MCNRDNDIREVINPTKCSVCKRNIPNKEHLTKKGCKYCDLEYHRRHK